MSSTGTQKTDISRFVRNNEQLHGIYRGVVEDRNDPLRLGRVRVRIWGVHTEEQGGDLNQAPWEELVWAHPILSNFSGSISDCGGWYIPLQGSHVMVFFENGNMMQPRYFGTVPGFPIDGAKYSQLEKQDGYIDPDEEYPLTDHIEEHDWHRLARVMNLDKTYLSIKEANLDLGVDIAFGGTWDEQPPMYETEYPHGNVWATEEEFDKNQVFELDGTPGAQRLQYWHPSKSYFEINKDGRYVFRNAYHRWDICDKNKHLHTMENIYEKVDMNKTLLVELEEWREILVNRWTRIHTDDWKEVKGANYHHILTEDYKKVDANQHYIVEGTYLEHIIEDKHLTIDTSWYEHIAVDKHLLVDASSYAHIIGGKHVSIDADYYEETKGSKHEGILTDMLTLVGSRCALTIGGDYLVYADSNIGITSAVIDICAEQIAIGNAVVYIGAEVNLGPIVNLGVDAAVASCIQGAAPSSPVAPVAPDLPDPPIDAPVPPVPPIPPEFPPPEIIIKMPEPAC